jgi:hypothetical protein
MCREKIFKKRIEKLAFKLYKARGNAPGSEKEDWSKAEQMVKTSFSFRLAALAARLKQSAMAVIILGVVVFLFGTLIVGLRDNRWVRQARTPEPAAAPLVEIEIARIDMVKKELSSGVLPALRCAFDGKLLNYGKAPAYIRRVDFFIKDSLLEEFAFAPLGPKKNHEEWPGMELRVGVRKAFTWEPVIDIVSAEVIMRIYLLDKDVHSKGSPFWKKKDKEITDELKKQIQPFGVIAQVEYYDAQDKELKNPYYYSVEYRVDRQLACSYYRCAKARWLSVGDSGVVSRIR